MSKTNNKKQTTEGVEIFQSLKRQQTNGQCRVDVFFVGFQNDLLSKLIAFFHSKSIDWFLCEGNNGT